MLLRSSVVLAGLSVLAAAAGAQGCVINSDAPAMIKGVRADYIRLIDAQANQGDKHRHYSSGLQRLTEEYRDDQENQIARWFLVGKTYVAWLSLGQAGNPAPFEDVMKKRYSTRGEAGFTLGDKKLKHDLFLALDSAFDKVEALNRACVDSTSHYRALVYTIVYNKARDLLHTHNYDSVVVLARTALVIDPTAAAPINLIANAYFEKGDMPAYRVALGKVAALPPSDSVTNNIRLNALKNLAVMSLNEARDKTGDTQKALAQDAVEKFREYLKSKPDDPEITSGLTGALIILGDTAAANALTQRMLSNPAQFSAQALFAAATASYNSAQFDNAVKFSEAGLAKNPYHRDGLFNYASTLLKTQDFEKAISVMRRVLALDPSNRKNFIQIASALQGAARATKDSAHKNAVQTDQLAFIVKRDSSPTWAAINQFDVVKDSITVVGEMHNQTTAPRSQQIDFEFLSVTGAVVSTGSVNVKDVSPTVGSLFTLTAKGTGVVAWRYKPFQQ